MTLKEKIAILEAMDRGETIQYSKTGEETNDWEDLKTPNLNFDLYAYRVKFKIGDKFVDKRADGEENPIRFELTSITDGVAKLDNCWEVSVEDLYKFYTFADDVLWYFETYDFSAQTWRMITDRRFAISEVSDSFKYEYNNGTLRPLYALGFKLKENQ